MILDCKPSAISPSLQMTPPYERCSSPFRPCLPMCNTCEPVSLEQTSCNVPSKAVPVRQSWPNRLFVAAEPINFSLQLTHHTHARYKQSLGPTSVSLVHWEKRGGMLRTGVLRSVVLFSTKILGHCINCSATRQVNQNQKPSFFDGVGYLSLVPAWAKRCRHLAFLNLHE